MAFGDKLQAIRRAAGLTQEQMAEELQVSRQAVSRWESNRSFPEVEKILAGKNVVKTIFVPGRLLNIVVK